MKAFEATTIVEPTGEVRVAGVPFSVGTEVEVIVSAKRQSGVDFRRKWDQVCRQLRRLPGAAKISDEEIEAEVAEHRAHR
jgi:hypothetical protein